jgi:hypothetical protein
LLVTIDPIGGGTASASVGIGRSLTVKRLGMPGQMSMTRRAE